MVDKPDTADHQADVQPSATYDVMCAHGRLFVTITRDSGRMRQVFVKRSQTIRPVQDSREAYEAEVESTAHSRAEAEVLGILISTALGNGASPKELAMLLQGVDCGHVYFSDKIPPYTYNNGISDTVGKVMMLDIQEYGE